MPGVSQVESWQRGILSVQPVSAIMISKMTQN